MRLSELLAALPSPPGVFARGGAADEDPVIRGIAYDSRSVTAGDLFFALRGELADGHDYLEQALNLGAAALVLEECRPNYAAAYPRFIHIGSHRHDSTRRLL